MKCLQLTFNKKESWTYTNELLQRLVFLTNEYLQLKERVRKLENEGKNEELNDSKDNKMRIDKAK